MHVHAYTMLPPSLSFSLSLSQSGGQQEEKQTRRRKRSVASPCSSDGSLTPTSEYHKHLTLLQLCMQKSAISQNPLHYINDFKMVFTKNDF